ncbi:MAG: cupredoxin domain-containing protein [Candidatus Limnocylindrales bacterium]
MDKLQELWTQILDLLSKLVIPDWGALIALLPVFLLAMIVGWLLFLLRASRKLGPRQRGPGRQPRVPPSGVHAPGPSFAPIFTGVGAALVFFGLVFGGAALILGLAALALTLLYWLREAMTDYDHVEGSNILPVVIEHEGPPPGVHVPGPTFLPIVTAVCAAILFAGLVVGGWVLLGAIVCLVTGLLSWLRAALVEYRLTVEADRTGHLRNAPPPAFPSGLFAFFVVVLFLAAVVQTGVLPPTGANAGSGASASSGTSAAPAGASGAPSGAPAPAADVTIVAQQVAYTTTAVDGPAGRPFTIAFQNMDQATQHNVEIKKSDGSDAFKGQIFAGVATMVYQVPALPAGTYPFNCSVHPSMTGTLTLK